MAPTSMALSWWLSPRVSSRVAPVAFRSARVAAPSGAALVTVVTPGLFGRPMTIGSPGAAAAGAGSTGVAAGAAGAAPPLPATTWLGWPTSRLVRSTITWVGAETCTVSTLRYPPTAPSSAKRKFDRI